MNFMVPGEWVTTAIFFPLIVIVCAWVFFWWRIWIKYGKEHPPVILPGYIKSPPSKISPAIVESLLTQGQKITVNSFCATILDLARRGVITIEVRNIQDNAIFGLVSGNTYTYILHLAEKDVLDNVVFLPHEALLINFLFSQADDHKTLEIDRIAKIIENDKYVTKKVLGDWVKQVKKESEKFNFIEPESRMWKRIFLAGNTLFVVLLFVIGMYLAGTLDSIIFLNGVLSFGPVVAVINGGLFLRWSKNSRGEVQKWLGFKRYMEDFGYFQDENQHVITAWEDMLVYGLVLDASKAVFDILPGILNHPGAVMPAWYKIGSDEGKLATIEEVKKPGDDLGSSLTASFRDMSSSFSNALSNIYGGGLEREEGRRRVIF